ncbi:MAG: hypothetical protein HOP16_06100 [Acidobacteria bacterium]|nr:hypothetical protein [Acidobacteriota bacterium]
MDHTADEMEALVDRTRDHLNTNMRELEHRVEAATDWREHFQERPYLFLGAAFIGGVVLGGALRRQPSVSGIGHLGPRHVLGSNSSVQAQAWDLWNNVQGALVGVASAGIQKYIGELLPGFEEHYRRAQQTTTKTSVS